MFQEMLLSENQSYSEVIAPIVAPPVVEAGHNMPVLTTEPQDQVSKLTHLSPKNNPINSIIGSPKSSPKQVRAPTAFNYFSREMYPIVHTQFSNLKKHEVTHLVCTMWSKMTEVDKSKYCQMSGEEQHRLTDLKNNREDAQNPSLELESQYEQTENLVFRKKVH